MNEHEMNTHHTRKEISSDTILAGSILLAAVIVGYAMISAASSIGTGLSAITISGSGTNTIPIAPTPTAGLGDNLPAPIVNMSDIIQNAAASTGSDDAPIILVEYSDYQCPFCRAWYNDSKSKLQTEFIDTGKVKLVYKDFPLSFHPMAQPYAEAARCAGDQQKYWEMHDKIFIEQNKKGQGTIQDYTNDNIKTWAQELGLDSASFNSCLDTGKYSQAVQANFQEGSQIGVTGTPAFFIGKADGTGQLIVGAQPYSVFQQAINSLS